jgi:hypothetical protein
MRTPAIGNSRAYGRFARRSLALAGSLLASAWLALWPAAAGAATLPAFPQAFVDTTYSLPTGGNTIAVHAGGDLQAAINSANLGDVIVVDAGATFNAPINLPNKTTGSGWIYVISSAYASLPAPGNRVSPADAVNMPKIVINDGTSDSAVQTDEGAHHFRFVGFEFAPAPGQFVYSVTIGGLLETSVSQLPHDITFDRCYFHGDPTVGGRRGIQLDAVRGAVIDSWFENFKDGGVDTQAVWTLNTPGPLKIVNNHLEAGSENLLLGGDDPTIPGVIPSDIEIRGNHFFKPLWWQSVPGLKVKNLLELKLGVRVLIEGNLFENNWASAQDGEGIVITPRNQNGTAPWAATQDITIRLNKVINVGKGMDISGYDDTAPDLNQPINVQTQRVLVENNLFDVTGLQGATARIFQFTHGAANVTVRHNTGSTIAVGGVSAIAADQDGSNAISPKGDQFDFRDNLLGAGGNGGFFGDVVGEGTSALTTFFTNWTFLDNAIYSNATRGPINPSWYPPNNFFPADATAVGFVNYTDPLVNFAGGNYALSATSPLKNAASDGLDVGADFSALNAASSCASFGACGSDPAGPAISGVAATGITSTTANIVWTTDSAATTRVEYGLTNGYCCSTTMNAALVTSHSQGLSGLLPATTYHYRVTSSDGAGNSTISADFTFTTVRASATFNLLSGQNPSRSGQAVTFATTVAGTVGTALGTVTFNDNGTAISGCTSLPLSAGAAQCTSSSLAAGAHPITVTYSGDATYLPGTSSTFIQTVNVAVALSTFRIGSNLNPSTFGQVITLGTTLTGTAGTPSGTVTFNDNGAPIVACTSLALSGGTAQCRSALLAVGAHVISVTYSGDVTYPAGTSTTLTQTVNAAVANFKIGSNLNPSIFGQTVTLGATLTGSAGTPSGTVTFNDNGTPVSACASLALSAGSAQCRTASLAVGTHAITITYSGDSTYPPGTSSAFIQTVNTAVASFNVGSNLNPSTLGQAVTLGATLSGTAGTPSGTVTFNDNGVPIVACTSLALSSGAAQCRTGLLAIGAHAITVTYSGDTTYPPGASSALTQTVNAAVANFKIGSNLNPAMSGQTFTLGATLTGTAGTPSGGVTFIDNGVPIAACTSFALSAGTAQCRTTLLAVGAHAITVTYSGDVTYPPGTSTTFMQTVNTAVANFKVGSDLNPAILGQAVTLGVTLSGTAGTPSGIVTFNDNGTPIVACASLALSGGGAQCRTALLGVGAHAVTVTYSGDVTYPPGTSTTLTQTVNAAVANFKIGSNLNPSIFGQTVTLGATLTGSAGTPSGTVTFNDNSTPIAACMSLALSGGSAQCRTASLAVGTHAITITYSGDSTYPPGTSTTLTQTVNAVSATIDVVLTPSDSSIWTQPVTMMATVTGAAGTPSGTVTFNENGTPISACTALPLAGGVAQCITASLAVGGHLITVTYSGNATYAPATSNNYAHTVGAAVATIDVVMTPSETSIFTQPVTMIATLTGSVGTTPTGTVTFNDNGTAILGCIALPLSGGAAQCTTASLAIGGHIITVTYSGDATYPATTSANYGQTVGEATASLDVGLTPNPSTPEQTVTLTVMVTGDVEATPTGMVTFNDNGTAIPECARLALSGGAAQCTTAWPVDGVHVITVTYSGDATYPPATSSNYTELVSG